MTDDYEHHPSARAPCRDTGEDTGEDPGEDNPSRPTTCPPWRRAPPVIGPAIFTAIIYGLAVWVGSMFNIHYAPEADIPWDIFYYVAYASWVWGFACNERNVDG